MKLGFLLVIGDLLWDRCVYHVARMHTKADTTGMAADTTESYRQSSCVLPED